MNEMNQIFGDAVIHFLPNELTDSKNLLAEFKALLGSKEADQDRGVVYFYYTSTPIQTKESQTNILYIGKTNGSIKSRYLKYATKLATGKNGEFYQQVIEQTGHIKVGYFKTDEPRKSEKVCFSKYRALHGQNPPKSKRG